MTTSLLTERIEDLTEAEGSVRWQVTRILDTVEDKLSAYEYGEATVDELGSTADQVGSAIATLERFQLRLRRLHERENKRWWKRHGSEVRAESEKRRRERESTTHRH